MPLLPFHASRSFVLTLALVGALGCCLPLNALEPQSSTESEESEDNDKHILTPEELEAPLVEETSLDTAALHPEEAAEELTPANDEQNLTSPSAPLHPEEALRHLALDIALLEDELRVIQQKIQGSLPHIIAYLKNAQNGIPATALMSKDELNGLMVLVPAMYAHQEKIKEKKQQLAEKLVAYERIKHRLLHNIPLSTPLETPRSSHPTTDKIAYVPPLKGMVISTYGQEAYAAARKNYGLLYCGTQPNEPVLSPVTGVVTYADTFSTYGKTIMIQPINEPEADYFIAGFGDLRVKAQEGKFFEQGRILGFTDGENVPDSQNTQACIYIEKRRQGIALPPAAWLSSSTAPSLSSSLSVIMTDPRAPSPLVDETRATTDDI